MASNKSFNPNAIPFRLSKMNNNLIETPLLNRATQGLYPPGSTFKVVTAAAGLESGTIGPETTIDAPGTTDPPPTRPIKVRLKAPSMNKAPSTVVARVRTVAPARAPNAV